MALTKEQIQLTEQQTKKVAEEIMAIPIGITLDARKVRVQELLQQYGTGEEAGTQRRVNTITAVTDQIIKLMDAIIPN